MPSPAQIVRLQSRNWLVEGVEADPGGAGHVVSLSCIDDDAQRQQLQVVWEAEIAPRVVGEEAWESIGSKDKRPALKRGESVVFDFEGVDNMTDSFSNACFANLFKRHRALVGNRIRFKACTPLIKDLVLSALAMADSKDN